MPWATLCRPSCAFNQSDALAFVVNSCWKRGIKVFIEDVCLLYYVRLPVTLTRNANIDVRYSRQNAGQLRMVPPSTNHESCRVCSRLR